MREWPNRTRVSSGESGVVRSILVRRRHGDAAARRTPARTLQTGLTRGAIWVALAAVASGLLAVPATAAETPPVPVRAPSPKANAAMASAKSDPLLAVPAKQLFGSAKVPAPLAARAIGFYSRGCLAGARQLAVDGPAWQAMRLSRNRNWGHPRMIALVEKLAKDVKAHDGWPGLMVGDISQPRGGPMLTGHASHQIGLDADIWLTKMPDRRLTRAERENLSATSMLGATPLEVGAAWTPEHVKLIRRAASYREVERVLVHPAIKKALCEATAKESPASRAWLGKVRPYWGHHYHMHIRMQCPPDSPNCRPQKPTGGEIGCDKELAYWFRILSRPKPPKPILPRKPVKPRPPMTIASLPQECRAVIEAPAKLTPLQVPTAAGKP